MRMLMAALITAPVLMLQPAAAYCRPHRLCDGLEVVAFDGHYEMDSLLSCPVLSRVVPSDFSSLYVGVLPHLAVDSS